MRRTAAVLADATGAIKSAVRMDSEPMSLHTTPPSILLGRLGRLLNFVLRDAGLELKCLVDASVCIGLTGVTFRYDREVILPTLLSSLGLKFSRLACTGDAEIVFASHASKDAGSAIICHSGSTAYVVTPYNGSLHHVRVGGWGPAIGDEGSGYWMGRHTLRAIARQHDEHVTTPSILWTQVDEWLRQTHDKAIAEWGLASAEWKKANDLLSSHAALTAHPIDPRTLVFYFAHKIRVLDGAAAHEGPEAWRRIISGLVLPLMNAWRRGDPVANDIIQSAARELALQLQTAFKVAVKEHSATSFAPLALYGGCLQFNSDFVDAVLQQLDTVGLAPQDVIRPTDPRAMRPVCGALLFALGGSETGSLRLPAPTVIERVRSCLLTYPISTILRND